MSIFNLFAFSIGAALCFYAGVKIAGFAYLAYSERVSWWWGKDDDRVKVSWVDFVLGAIWLFASGACWLVFFAAELLK